MNESYLFAILCIVLYIPYAIVHEYSHILTARRLGYKCAIKPHWLGIKVKMEPQFPKRWKDFSVEEKASYKKIAFAPYFITAPVLVLLIILVITLNLPSYITYAIIVLCIVNVVNLPFEFVVD